MTALPDVVNVAVPPPSAERVARLADWLLRVNRHAATLRPATVSYLVVTPLGRPARELLASELVSGGIEVVSRLALPAWPRIATALRVREATAQRVRRAAWFEAAWSALFAGEPAEAWAVPRAAHRQVALMKRRLRTRVRSLEVAFGTAPVIRTHLHPFHLADEADADLETRRLHAAVALAR